MIEELWANFREVFDYTFPEIQVLEVSEDKPGTFRITAYFGVFCSMVITTSQWDSMTQPTRKLMTIALIHKILDQIEEISRVS